MNAKQQELRIPMQVGSELRIHKNGEIVVDNPEVELAMDPRAADATLAYRFDPAKGEYVLRLLDPVADHKHIPLHRRDD